MRWLILLGIVIAVVGVPTVMVVAFGGDWVRDGAAGAVPQYGVALGTIAVAIAAIWGDKLRDVFCAPRLIVSLLNPRGQPVSTTGDYPTRYYHLQVRNERRWALAKNVRVLLTDLSRPVPGGAYQRTSQSGPLALSWQHLSYKGMFLNIAHVAETCDLGHVEKQPDVGPLFRLECFPWPNDFEGTLDKSGGDLRVHVLAVADNAVSEPLIVDIHWDGEWHDSEDEMSKHLIVSAVPCP